MNVGRIIHDELVAISREPSFAGFPQSFVYPDTLERNSILFIGINPSAQKDDLKGVHSYSLSQDGSHHQYFKKFEDIAKYCKTKWSHLDLLYFKETQQTKVHEILKTDLGKEFVWKQLQITDRLIKKSAAKVIVVNNTLARDLLGFAGRGWLDYKFEFNNELGTYLWNDTPVFFSSMLTGQRALDVGSYERLQWHIRKALIFRLEVQLKDVHELKENLVSRQEYEKVALERDKERRILEELDLIKF